MWWRTLCSSHARTQGVAPVPSRLLTLVLQTFAPARPSSALLFSSRGSARPSSVGAIPARLYKAPAGPFGKRISFFLDAFPDLGATEGLCAARAGAGLPEEELGGPGPRTLETLETWPRALSVKSTTSARVRLTLFFCYHRSRRRRSLQGREEPELGAFEPCGAKR